MRRAIARCCCVKLALRLGLVLVAVATIRAIAVRKTVVVVTCMLTAFLFAVFVKGYTGVQRREAEPSLARRVRQSHESLEREAGRDMPGAVGPVRR